MRSAHNQVTEFIEEARYTDDFQRVEVLLLQISDKLSTQEQE